MALGTQSATIGGAPKTLIVALDQGGNLASAHVAVNSSGVEVGTQANPLIVATSTTTSGAALDGTDATGVTAPAGGVGIRGWLSGSYSVLGNILTALAGILKVNIQNSSLAVTGTFFQATQPVSGTVTANAGTGTMTISATALPLPTGAATSANQPALNADGGALSHIQNFPSTQAVTQSGGPWSVTGTFFQASQPVSLAALPALPTGANTIGNVGQANSPWSVSWSGQTVAATQSGTWTVALATGSTVTLGAGSAAIGSVSVSGSVAVTGAFYQATQPVSVASLPLPSNAAQDGTDATGVTAPTGGSGIRGWLSGSYQRLSQIYTAVTGTLTVQDTASIAALGAPADASWGGTGTGTFIAISKALYGKLAGVLSVTINGALPTGTNVIGAIQQAGSWVVSVTGNVAVSAANLPLPAGASTETTLAAVNTKLGGTLSVSQASALPAGANSLGTVGLNAGANAIGTIVGQRPFEAVVTITRPANTTAYAAGQVLSTATTALTAFPAMAFGIGNNQRFTIQAAVLLSSNGAATTRAQLSLFLFNAPSPPGGGFNDASTFAPTAAALGANGNALVGLVPSSLAQAGAAAYGLATYNVGLQGVTDATGNIYPAIVLNNAYSPTSGETVSIKIVGYY